jgi:O-antigen ligase
MIGPPNVPIKEALLSFDSNKILSIFANADIFYRTTDTPLRLLVFISSIAFFVLMIFNRKQKTHVPKFITFIMPPAVYLFLATILITDGTYNYIAVFIILISFYFFIFYSKNNLSLSEIFIILSYLIIFLIPFFSSLFHETTFSEIDNYTRFLLVIPVYLTLREIKFSSVNLFNAINITSILIGLFSIYCLLILGETRVRGFTSTAIIFGNISLLFSLFSFLTISHYLHNNKNIFFPIIASIFAFFAWGATGSRGSIILIIIFLILLTTKPFKKTLKLSNNLIIIFILTATVIFISSPIFTRYSNAYQSTYNYIIEGSEHYWMHSDSIVPRINIWKGSVILIKKNIASGVGLNNFNSSLAEEIKLKNIKPMRNFSNNPTAGMNHAHNQYLDIFVKTGIFGFFALIFFIIMNLYFFYDRYKSSGDHDAKLLSLLGVVSIFGYMSYMLTHSVLSHQLSTLFMTLLLTILSAIITNKIRSN